MSTSELKQAIIQDLNELKYLEIEIIPAKIYYIGLLKLAAGAFWKIGLILFLSILYVFLTYSNPDELMREVYSGVIPVPAWKKVYDALFMTTEMAFIATLVLSRSLRNYFLIQYHLKDSLITGDILVEKLQNSGWLFLLALILFSIMFASYAEPDRIFFFEGMALCLSAAVTYFVMGMEFNRIGFSLLFTAVGHWFGSSKT